MICERCKKKDATVFYTKLANGKNENINLCEDCAEDCGINELDASSLLGSFINENLSQSEQNNACPSCGFTRQDFKRISRFGCADCYQTFSDDLANMLSAMQKGKTHIGKKSKVPKSESDANLSPQKIKIKLEELNSNLNEAVENEKYEEAAELRDKISEIKNLLSSSKK